MPVSGWTFLWGASISATLLSIVQIFEYYPHSSLYWFTYLMPWALIVLLPALFTALAFRRHWLSLSLSAPVVYIVALHAFLFLPGRATEPSAEQPVRVMSYNVWSKNQSMESVASVVRRENPEIVFFQEVDKDKYNALLELFIDSKSKTHWHSLFEPSQLLAIFSRFPLAPAEKYQGTRTKVQIATATYPNQTLKLYNVHFLRGSGLKRYARLRAFIEDELAQAKGPIVLAGDMNMTLGTPAYSQLRGIMTNSHDQAGWGFGFTYPARSFVRLFNLPLPPMVRIDHIFHSPDIETVSAKTLPESGGSDHYPVTAVLSMTQTKD